MNILTVKKLGTASVIVDIVEKGNFEIRPAYEMNPSEIAVHNTGNNGRGANAKAHNIYIHNQAGKSVAQTGYASWHFSVDDKFIYQHLPLNESAWHTGDGNLLISGNRSAIGIEICENPETNTAQAEENAIALIAYLVKVLNINVQKVKPHQAYSGKFCPRVILKRDGGFSKFHARVVKATKPKPVVKPKPIVKPVVKPVVESVSITKFSPVRIGKVTGDVWSQKTSVYSAKRRVKILKKDASYKVYAESNGFYNVGTDEWISKGYMDLTGTVEPPKPVQLIGEITTDVWSQLNPFYLNTGRVKVLKKGARYKVYAEKNGYYSVGGSEWVNSKYMKLV